MQVPVVLQRWVPADCRKLCPGEDMSTSSTGFLHLPSDVRQKILHRMADTALEAPTALFRIARTCKGVHQELKVCFI